jgi:hypothetical protein
MLCATPSDACVHTVRAAGIPLLPETTLCESGAGPALSLPTRPGGALVFTLEVTRVIERESLDISVWGSPDGADWGAKPLVRFTRKFSCGSHQVVVDQLDQAGVKFLRAQWHVDRWAQGPRGPLFTVHLHVAELQHRALAAAAGQA